MKPSSCEDLAKGVSGSRLLSSLESETARSKSGSHWRSLLLILLRNVSSGPSNGCPRLCCRAADGAGTPTTSGSASSGSGSAAASPAPLRRLQRVEILKIAEGTPLIDPTEVVVSQGAVLTAEPVLTPLGTTISSFSSLFFFHITSLVCIDLSNR